MLCGGDCVIDVVVIDFDIKVIEYDVFKIEGYIIFKVIKEGKLYFC